MSTAILRIAAPAPGAQEYPITLVLRDENGQDEPKAATTCPLSLQPPGMANALSAQDLQRLFAEAQGQDEAIRTIGVQLYTLVSGNGVAERMAELPPGAGIVLAVEPPELRRLPWELLWDEDDGRAFFLDDEHPMCRGLPAIAAAPAQEWPLRMMIVVGARDDDPAATPQPEVEQIWRQLGGREPDIDLLIRRRLRRADLVAEITAFQPHILHFIGHGSADDEEGDAYLELDTDGPGGKQPWTATEIRNDLNKLRNLRLVFLNACRTSAARANGLWSVADAFLRIGASAVVSTRLDIAGADAALIATTFYATLAEGKPVDTAVAAARRRIDQEYGGSLKRREWGALCLQVQAEPRAILTLDGSVPAQRRKFVKLNLSTALGNVKSYVDRVQERSATWQSIRIPEEPRLLALVGESKVGKTALAELLVVRCALADWLVRYVNLALQPNQNFLRVLELIRSGTVVSGQEQNGGDPLLTEAFDAALFGDFDNLLAQLAGPLTPGAAPPDILRQPANLARLFGAFRAALEQIVVQSNKQRMVIVLDHLYTVTTSEFRILREHLLRPYLLDETSRLRIVLLLRTEDYASFEIGRFDDLVAKVEVQRFPLQQWDELAFQYMLRRLDESVDEDKIRDFVQGNRSLLSNAGWTPDVLDGISRIAQMLIAQR